MKRSLFVCFIMFISVCLFASGQQEVQAVNPEDYASTALDGYPIEGLGWNVTSDVKAEGEYTIACVVKNNTNPWMAGFSGGFEKAAESMGFTPIVLSPAKNDNIEEQARVVDDLIQRQVDGIVITPIDSNGIVPCLERAYAAGIPVIVVGTAANTDQIFGFIGTQYYEQGKYIAEYIVEALGGKGNIINLPGPPEAQNAHERNAGIRGFSFAPNHRECFGVYLLRAGAESGSDCQARKLCGLYCEPSPCGACRGAWAVYRRRKASRAFAGPAGGHGAQGSGVDTCSISAAGGRGAAWL